MMTDKLLIRNLRLYGHTGYFPEEKKLGVHMQLDLEIQVDLALAAKEDDLTQTLDYGGLVYQLEDLVAHSQFDLLETLATQIARCILAYACVNQVKVTLTKCPLPLPFGELAVAIEIERDRVWAATS